MIRFTIFPPTPGVKWKKVATNQVEAVNRQIMSCVEQLCKLWFCLPQSDFTTPDTVLRPLITTAAGLQVMEPMPSPVRHSLVHLVHTYVALAGSLLGLPVVFTRNKPKNEIIISYNYQFFFNNKDFLSKTTNYVRSDASSNNTFLKLISRSPSWMQRNHWTPLRKHRRGHHILVKIVIRHSMFMCLIV